MKRHLLSALAASVCLLGLLPATLRAQSAVPGQITYQGKVSDAAGNLIGAGTPVNRKVRFRIYNDPTSVLAGNRLHTEEQTVTIANGEFNVLLGLAGATAVSGETFVASLDTIFNGAARYLGVTVDGGSGTFSGDPEISPRQQIVTMPFAFRAKVAESVVGSTATSNVFQATGNVGIGTNAPAAPLTLFNGSEARFHLQTTGSGATTGDGLAIVHSNAGYIYEYENVPLHFGTNAATRMTIAANGYVGVGTQNPTAPFSLGVALGNTKFALWDDGTGGLYGMGIQGNQFRLHTNQTGDRFSFLSSTAGNEVFTIKSTGQVGIGATNPAYPLSFGTTGGNTLVALYDDNINRFGLGIGNNHMRLHVGNSGQRFGFFNAPAGSEVLTILGNGNIGQGHNTPAFLFSQGGGLANTKLAVFDDSVGSVMGFGAQANQFRFHVAYPTNRFSFLNGPAGTEVMTVTGDGKLGIGTGSATPYGLMQVHSGTTDSRMSFTTSGTTSAHGRGLLVGIDSAGAFLWNSETNLPLRLASGGAERQLIYPDGRMGFNGPNGDPNLGFAMATGTAYMMVLYSGSNGWRYSFENNGTATKFGSSSWTIFSDARLKKNVAPLDGSLERLLKLRSVNFDWNDERNGQGRQTGFIAQEVQQVFPDWVKTNPSGYLTVEHKGFESQTVQALRELRAEKDAQLAQRDATIAALEQRIRDLETQTTARLAAIERRLNASALSANSPR